MYLIVWANGQKIYQKYPLSEDDIVACHDGSAFIFRCCDDSFQVFEPDHDCWRDVEEL